MWKAIMFTTIAIIVVGVVLVSLSKVRSEYKTVDKYNDNVNIDMSMFI